MPVPLGLPIYRSGWYRNDEATLFEVQIDAAAGNTEHLLKQGQSVLEMLSNTLPSPFLGFLCDYIIWGGINFVLITALFFVQVFFRKEGLHGISGSTLDI